MKMMDKRQFERFAEIVSQMNEIVRGQRGQATGLSQAKLASAAVSKLNLIVFRSVAGCTVVPVDSGSPR
jgi:ribosome-binding protein aMBF1 (putative translation factor)